MAQRKIRMARGARNLSEWIAQQLKDRGMSGRAFSKLVGVSNSTISEHLSEDDPPTPTLPILLAFAEGTNTSLTYLIALAFPDNAEKHGIDPDAILWAEKLHQVPEETRALINKLLIDDEDARLLSETIIGLPEETRNALLGIIKTMQKQRNRGKGGK